MASRVSVVTGGNKGIGYGIVKNLCEQFKGVVYLTARDVNRGKAAVESLNKLGLKPEFHQLDIEDENSIQIFANFLKEKHGGIDVLVNNAAIAFKFDLLPPLKSIIREWRIVDLMEDQCKNPNSLSLKVFETKIFYWSPPIIEAAHIVTAVKRPSKSQDATDPFGYQAEVTLRVNYFALVKLCEILFPLLRPHARVVNVSSSAGHLLRIPGEEWKKKFSDSKLTVEELSNCMNSFVEAAARGDHEQKGWPNSAYVVSKVGVSALTRIQHQQFLDDPRKDIVINHVHPGYVNTDMSSHKGPLTIEEGADAPTYAALLPEDIQSPKGDYIWYTRQIVDWVKGPIPSKN